MLVTDDDGQNRKIAAIAIEVGFADLSISTGLSAAISAIRLPACGQALLWARPGDDGGGAMTAAHSELLQISTHDLPERDRLEFAREVYGRIIIKHEVEPVPGEPHYLRGMLRRLPDLAIASLACSAVHTNRTPAQIDNDDLVLCVNLAGGRVLRQLGREAVLGQGEAVLSTSAEVGTCDIASNSRWISVRIPLVRLAPMVADLHSALIRPIPAGTEFLSLLVNYIGTLRDWMRWRSRSCSASSLPTSMVWLRHHRRQGRRRRIRTGPRPARCTSRPGSSIDRRRYFGCEVERGYRRCTTRCHATLCTAPARGIRSNLHAACSAKAA